MAEESKWDQLRAKWGQKRESWSDWRNKWTKRLGVTAANVVAPGSGTVLSAATSMATKQQEKKGLGERLSGFFSMAKNKSIKKKCPKCGWTGPNEAEFCGNCGTRLEKSDITTTGKIVQFLVYWAGFVFVALMTVAQTASDLLATVGFTVPAYVFAIIIGLLLAAIPVLAVKKWKYSIPLFLIIVVAMVAISSVSGSFAISVGDWADRLKMGDIPISIETGQQMWCYYVTNPNDQSCYKKATSSVFKALKSYNTLDITLGAERYSVAENRIAYVVPTIYPEEKFSVPFYIENLNKKPGSTKDKSSIKFDNIIIGKDKDTHVWAYTNRTLALRKGTSPFIFAAQSVDACSAGNPCTLEPEEKIKVYAEGFIGGVQSCIEHGRPCADIEYCENKCPYENGIPCEEATKGMKNLEFEIALKYDYTVYHTRTLVVARNEDEASSIQPKDVPSLTSEIPTDGPLDLVIDFDTSPYSLDDRRELKMTVSIVNGQKDSGGMYISRNDNKVEIEIVGGIPAWMKSVENATTNVECSLDAASGKITVKLNDRYNKFMSDEIDATCDFQIDRAASIERYVSLSFAGSFEYSYLQKKEFFASDQIVKVNTDMCPVSA